MVNFFSYFLAINENILISRDANICPIALIASTLRTKLMLFIVFFPLVPEVMQMLSSFEIFCI